MISVAVRWAYALGLHIRNEDPSASSTKKEMLGRLWWSLYTLERLLSLLTGRPSSITDSCCSVPQPVPIAEEQMSGSFSEGDFSKETQRSFPMQGPISWSGHYDERSSDARHSDPHPSMSKIANSASYFRAVVQLSSLTHDVLNTMYAPGMSLPSLGELQQDINIFSQRLDGWIRSLPGELNFHSKNAVSRRFQRERTLLVFQHCSARILLTRPCLGGLGQDIGQQSFTRRMAYACVRFAQTVVDFLPDHPDTSLYENGPWWCMVHSLMQAASVMLLALAYTTAFSQDTISLSNNVKKLIIWLRAMPDPVAERAARVTLNVLQALATRLSIDLSDLMIVSPIGPTGQQPTFADNTFETPPLAPQLETHHFMSDTLNPPMTDFSPETDVFTDWNFSPEASFPLDSIFDDQF